MLTTAQKILRVLQSGPKTCRELQKILCVPLKTARLCLSELSKDGLIVKSGKRSITDKNGQKRPHNVFALPDSEPVPKTPVIQPIQATGPSRRGKSGVIARKVTIGRGFRWGAGL